MSTHKGLAVALVLAMGSLARAEDGVERALERVERAADGDPQMSEEIHTNTSCSSSSCFGEPDWMIRRLRSEWTKDAAITSVPTGPSHRPTAGAPSAVRGGSGRRTSGPVGHTCSMRSDRRLKSISAAPPTISASNGQRSGWVMGAAWIRAG